MTRIEYKQIQWKIYHRVNENNIVERYCTQCKEWIEENTENFYLANKSYPERGYNSRCKKCNIKNNIKRKGDDGYNDMIKSQIKYNKTPGRKQAMRERSEQQRKDGKQKIWQRNNPDKIKWYIQKHRIHDITETEWRSCLKVFDHKCAYCGMTENEHIELFNQVLHREHADNEGNNDLSNAIPSCGSCNYKKWAFPMEEWYREQEFFTEEKLEFIKWWLVDGHKQYIEDKPPYKIIRKQNKDKKTFHWELWSVDEKRNMLECLDIKDKKNQLDIHKIIN